MDIPKGQYLKNLLTAIDQLANAIIGNYCDETLSSASYRASRDGVRHWPRRLIDALFFWDRKGSVRHCELSYNSEQLRLQCPPELRPKS